jgi:hypothetical protein
MAKNQPYVEITQNTVSELLNNFDNFIFDCDGVLWRTNTLVEGADTSIEFLRSLVPIVCCNHPPLIRERISSLSLTIVPLQEEKANPRSKSLELRFLRIVSIVHRMVLQAILKAATFPGRCT